MKIGMILPTENPMDSVGYVVESTIAALQQEHQLVFRPPNYVYQSHAWQKNALREILLSCDILLGDIEDLALQVRQEINLPIPYLCLMLGRLPRGNMSMMKNYHLLRTTDVLLVSCVADLEIANHFFENAQVRLLPFAFKESDFYPLAESAKQAFRAKLGFDANDRILVYCGRITIEKNVHSVLKIFSVIEKLIPNAHLVIAGGHRDVPFLEFGAFSVNIKGSLEKVVAKLGMDQTRIRFLGHQERSNLCNLYNIADAVINMTLHHDENFGLAQIEAMACGTPVIGTDWGGLKDTIVDGETGYKVSTTVTASGVKLNWWEAVDKILTLLRNNAGRLRMRQNCASTVHHKYSLSNYRQNLQSILSDCQKQMEIGSPLKASEFAWQYWNSRVDSSNSYHLYKELILPYAGTSPDLAAINQELTPDHVLCLAAPLSYVDEDSFEINDPIFPLSITIPVEYKKTACAVIEAMKEEPAITVGRLTGAYLAGQEKIHEVLEWMVEAGLIFKGGLENEAFSTRHISSRMSLPLFSFQAVDSSSDIVIFR